MDNQYVNPAMVPATGKPRGGFVSNRLYNFGLTMVVMGASFILYYLGLFGTVDGPLTPDNLGIALSGLGVTQHHVITVLLSILIFAFSWNWVFNLTSALLGARMTCKALEKTGGGVCGAAVTRTRHASKRTGRTVVEYVCPHGHRRSEAHFHPVKKGPISNTACLACLAFVLIAVFCV